MTSPRITVLLALLLSPAAFADDTADKLPNPDAIQAIASGNTTVANAAWWGFNAEDATESLQAAIDSGARKVIVPYMGRDWTVRPLRLASDLELVFEPGVVVAAKRGEFKGTGDSLFSAKDLHDLTLRGYGAAFRMPKEDYQSSAYEKGEWRMAIDITGCSRVNVLGLTLDGSGGDGIYLGVSNAERPYCEDVVIRDVVCTNHHRQGISVISAKNLLIEHCGLANTDGTAPEAGIDFEPNSSNERLENCVMRGCVIENNAGAGILIYAKNLSRESAPVAITVEDCYVRSGRDVGIGVGAIKDDGPQGLIEFRNCTVENTVHGGIFVYDKAAENCRLRFVNCNWKNVGVPVNPTSKRKPGTPLLLTLLRRSLTQKYGGIDFVDCHVYNTLDRPILIAEGMKTCQGLWDVTGRITVHAPYPARADYKCECHGVDLTFVNAQE